MSISPLITSDIAENGVRELPKLNLVSNTRPLKKGKSALSFVVLPTDYHRKVWDLLQLFALVYIAITVPARVGFEVAAVGAWYVVELFIDAVFIADVILNFFTAYEAPDIPESFVVSHRLIARHYLASWFAFDLIASVPLDRIINILDGTFFCSINANCPCFSPTEGGLLRFFKVLRLIKLVRLLHWSKLLERLQDSTLFNVIYYFQMCRELIILLYIGHVTGCLFYYFSTSTFRTDEEKVNEAHVPPLLKSWLTEQFGVDPNAASPLVRYIASVHWSFQTFITTGYGDISSRTNAERVVAILGLVLGGIYFSRLVITCIEIYKAMNRKKNAEEARYLAAHAFLATERVPSRLRADLMRFYRRQSSTREKTEVNKILQHLPFDIKIQVIDHVCRGFLPHCPLLRGCSDVFISAIFLHLEEIMFVEHDIVIKRGDFGNCLYFVNRGRLEALDQSGNRVVGVLRHGAYFGEGPLFGESIRVETIRAASFCSVFSLPIAVLVDNLCHAPHLLDAIHPIWRKRKESIKLRAGSVKASLAHREENPWCKEYFDASEGHFRVFSQPRLAQTKTTTSICTSVRHYGERNGGLGSTFSFRGKSTLVAPSRTKSISPTAASFFKSHHPVGSKKQLFGEVFEFSPVQSMVSSTEEDEEREAAAHTLTALDKVKRYSHLALPQPHLEDQSTGAAHKEMNSQASKCSLNVPHNLPSTSSILTDDLEPPSSTAQLSPSQPCPCLQKQIEDVLTQLNVLQEVALSGPPVMMEMNWTSEKPRASDCASLQAELSTLKRETSELRMLFAEFMTVSTQKWAEISAQLTDLHSKVSEIRKIDAQERKDSELSDLGAVSESLDEDGKGL